MVSRDSPGKTGNLDWEDLTLRVMERGPKHRLSGQLGFLTVLRFRVTTFLIGWPRAPKVRVLVKETEFASPRKPGYVTSADEK